MSPNNYYTRGAAFERTIAEYLRGFGWFAVRSAGSHGLVDVLAIDQDGKPHFIQCKTGKAKMTKADKVKLDALAETYGGWAYEVTPETYKEIL